MGVYLILRKLPSQCSSFTSCVGWQLIAIITVIKLPLAKGSLYHTHFNDYSLVMIVTNTRWLCFGFVVLE